MRVATSPPAPTTCPASQASSPRATCAGASRLWYGPSRKAVKRRTQSTDSSSNAGLLAREDSHVTLGMEAVGMKHTIQVRIFRGEHQYVAECLDLPVVTQALTLDELTTNV